MEGVSNEACSLAGHWGLGKLIALYDDNKISIDGHTEISFTEDVNARFEALGWHVQHVKVGLVITLQCKDTHSYQTRLWQSACICTTLSRDLDGSESVAHELCLHLLRPEPHASTDRNYQTSGVASGTLHDVFIRPICLHGKPGANVMPGLDL